MWVLLSSNTHNGDLVADDIGTTLSVSGGQHFIATMTAAAQAQQRLIDVVSKASSIPPIEVAGATRDLVQRLSEAGTAAKAFAEAQGANEKAGLRVTEIIERQTKALSENAAAQKRAAESARLLSRPVIQQQALREGERALQNRLFTRQNPILTRGPLNVPDAVSSFRAAEAGQTALTASTTRLRDASLSKNKALDEQSAAHRKGSSTGISYLSTLSAIHAASFLATNRTFTLAGSFATLGLAFTKLGPGASIVGLAVGGALGAFGAFNSTLDKLTALASNAVGVLVHVGAGLVAVTAAAATGATKLAADIESVFAEVVAFGEPTKEQLVALEEQISGIGRRFGESAQQIGIASSLLIRAGGGIAEALDGGTLAVTRLQIAARGELVPATAARAIVSVTNAFREQGVTAEQASDILVGTAQKTTLSFSEVTQAFQQAAPTAANLGISLLDLSATIGVLANQGLRGQVAGTGLKQVLLDLANPSKQAKALLQQYNISLFDTNEKLRPLPDVFADLNRAFGSQAEALNKTGDASRAQGLAIVFGSRANLAAAIIARTGAQAFLDLKEAIGSVSAEDIVETLLIPTNQQLEIGKTNVEEFARAFGGPLNVAIGSGIKKVNEFLQSIDRKHFERAGQAVLAVGAGAGFGPVIASIEELVAVNPKLATFFTQVLNGALTVRNAIVTQLVPAFQQAGVVIDSAISTSGIENGLQGVTRAIVVLIDAGSRLTGFFADIISDFLLGNARGLELRNTLAGLATAIGTAFVGALVATAIPLALTVTFLQATGKAMIDLLGDLGRFNSLWDAGWQLAKDSVNNFLKAVAPGLQQVGQFLVAIATHDTQTIARLRDQLGGEMDAKKLANDLGSVQAATTKVTGDFNKLTDQIVTLRNERDALIKSGPSLPDLIAGAGTGTTRLQEIDKQLESLRGQARGLSNTAIALTGLDESRRQVLDANEAITNFRNTITAIQSGDIKLEDVLGFSEGEVVSWFDAMLTRYRTVEGVVKNLFAGPTTEPGFLPDVGNEKRIADQIADLWRSTVEDIVNLTEDSDNRIAELGTSTVRRLAVSIRNFTQQMVKIDENTSRQEEDLRQSLLDSRSDRAFLKSVQDVADSMVTLNQEANARRDLSDQHSEQVFQRTNQRRLQDVDKTLSSQQTLEERAFSTSQSLADRAFSRGQADSDRALSRRQSAEERALSRTLDAQSQARTDARDLAQAKTPQERAGVSARIAQAQADRQFSEGQQTALDALQKRHDNERVAAQRAAEDQAFQFRLNQEVAAFEFRLKLEARFQTTKRHLEDDEFVLGEQRDRTQLERRLGNTRLDAGNQRQIEVGLQRAQDYIAEVQQGRQIMQGRRNAQRQKDELETAFGQDVQEQFQTFQEALAKEALDRAKRERAIRQRVEQRAQNIEQAGGGGSALSQTLNAIDQQLLDSSALFDINIEKAHEFLGLTLVRALPTIGVPTPNLIQPAPSIVPSQTVQEQLAAAAAIVRSTPGLAQAEIVAQGVYTALVRADADGISLADIDLRGLVLGSPELSPQQILQRLTRR